MQGAAVEGLPHQAARAERAPAAARRRLRPFRTALQAPALGRTRYVAWEQPAAVAHPLSKRAAAAGRRDALCPPPRSASFTFAPRDPPQKPHDQRPPPPLLPRLGPRRSARPGLGAGDVPGEGARGVVGVPPGAVAKRLGDGGRRERGRGSAGAHARLHTQPQPAVVAAGSRRAPPAPPGAGARGRGRAAGASPAC
jgi:hypothetical protein